MSAAQQQSREILPYRHVSLMEITALNTRQPNTAECPRSSAKAATPPESRNMYASRIVAETASAALGFEKWASHIGGSDTGCLDMHLQMHVPGMLGEELPASNKAWHRPYSAHLASRGKAGGPETGLGPQALYQNQSASYTARTMIVAEPKSSFAALAAG
ncbi:hypothetical protein CSOJ01_10540 [Colletotrichum sojae]|uniref:Uncharacterized protein n=1 Tax=Colletotrichum sojae TaxID=2175907 RepID=A0A8H6J0B5_9PEZI|nr:hypothetical protein CSOJ01_10540 [Colletotrichum sojae]